MTPNDVILQPQTMYGVTKVFNEQLGEYYANKFDLDFRSIRYPGVISSMKYAFNGTTDYSTGKYIKVMSYFIDRNIFPCPRKESLRLLVGPKTSTPYDLCGRLHQSDDSVLESS